MTQQSAVVNPVWVLDAMCLIHFGRADRLDVLRGLLVDKECWTTQVVLEELNQGAAGHPALRDMAVSDWLKIAASLENLQEGEHLGGRSGHMDILLNDAALYLPRSGLSLA